MKKIFVMYCLIVILTFVISITSYSQQNLSLNMDVCQYRFNSDSSLIEIYYSVLPGSNNSSGNSSFVLELRISKNKKPVITNLWKVQQEELNGENKQTQMVVDALRYLLAPGNYDFKLIAKSLLQPNCVEVSYMTVVGQNRKPVTAAISVSFEPESGLDDKSDYHRQP